jgi:pimeloyl-ACP methyl ester carboxylesterase
VITSEELATRCREDPEFRRAARYWNGGLRLDIGDVALAVWIRDGEPSAEPLDDASGLVAIGGPSDLWDLVLADIPPRFCNDVLPAAVLGLQRTGDDVVFWQYYPAVARAVELLRSGPAGDRLPTPNSASSPAGTPRATFDSPVGRYIHVELQGHDHRIYIEEAGSGIPLLLAHTAGSSSVQWRHLFETTAITDHFHLIAYDLPFHGKSLPPTSRPWWSEEYKLTREFALAVPVALAAALGLDRPAFMGCSVGGQIALDLARYHADDFSAVISLEPALKLDADGHGWTRALPDVRGPRSLPDPPAPRARPHPHQPRPENLMTRPNRLRRSAAPDDGVVEPDTHDHRSCKRATVTLCMARPAVGGGTSQRPKVEVGALVVGAVGGHPVGLPFGVGRGASSGTHPLDGGGDVVHPVHGHDRRSGVATVHAGHRRDVIDGPAILDPPGCEPPTGDRPKERPELGRVGGLDGHVGQVSVNGTVGGQSMSRPGADFAEGELHALVVDAA